MWDALHRGDILLVDRLYCCYCLLALALQRHVDMAARLHQRRKADFRRGHCIARDDRLIEWHRPTRPEWMDEATYATIPATMRLRQIRAEVQEPGFRAERMVVVTTLLDAERYPAQDIVALYHDRWNAELDLRTLKQSLAMDHLRCKTPEMVRKEIWTAWLGYNLIRKGIAQAALVHGKLPRQIGFAGAAGDRRLLGSAQRHLAVPDPYAGPRSVPRDRQPQRGRPSPPSGTGAIKRRPKQHRLLTKPRAEARKETPRGGRQTSLNETPQHLLRHQNRRSHVDPYSTPGLSFSGQTAEEWLIPRAPGDPTASHTQPPFRRRHRRPIITSPQYAPLATTLLSL